MWTVWRPHPQDAQKALGLIQGSVRTLKDALETRIQCEVEPSWPIMAWLVEHAAAVLPLYPAGRDGKTAYERLMRQWPKPNSVKLCGTSGRSLEVGTNSSIAGAQEFGLGLGKNQENPGLGLNGVSSRYVTSSERAHMQRVGTLTM